MSLMYTNTIKVINNFIVNKFSEIKKCIISKLSVQTSHIKITLPPPTKKAVIPMNNFYMKALPFPETTPCGICPKDSLPQGGGSGKQAVESKKRLHRESLIL